MTVNVVDLLVVPSVAEMLTAVWADTVDAMIVAVPVVEPPGTVIDDGAVDSAVPLT